MELYLAVLAGACLYLMFSLNEALKVEGFAWLMFFKQHYMETVLNIVCGFVLVWQKDEVSRWLPFTGLVALFVGTAGQAILRKVFKIFDKKVETYVGFNE